jgi:formyl-CoA transferase
MFDHPQVVAEGILATFEHRRVGRYRGMAHPVHLGAAPAPAAFTAPALGEHARQILAALGYSREEIERLHDVGAVIGPVKEDRT